jgi:hypothetical protein
MAVPSNLDLYTAVSPTPRELRLEGSVRELGILLSSLANGGKFAPAIADALARARRALVKTGHNI